MPSDSVVHGVPSTPCMQAEGGKQDQSLSHKVLCSLPLLTCDGRQVYPCVFQNRDSCGPIFGTDLFCQLYIRQEGVLILIVGYSQRGFMSN